MELPGDLLLKQFGKVAQWGDGYTEFDDWDIRVVLDSLEVDPRCDEFTSPPQRGPRLLLSLRVETGPKYDQAIHRGPWHYEWSTIGTDGMSEAPMSASYSCRQAVSCRTRCAVREIPRDRDRRHGESSWSAGAG